MEVRARSAITTSNYGPVVSVVAWSIMAAVIFCSVLKFVLAKVYIGLGPDDGLILASVLLSIAQTIATSFQAANGAGKHIQTLDEHQIQVYQQAGYATEILYVLVLVCTKLSTISLIYRLSPRTLDRRAGACIAGFVAIWNLASLLVVCFQCNVPYTWKIIGGQCIDWGSFWMAYGIINILTEVALIMLPSAIVINTTMKKNTKIAMVAVFNARLVLVAVIGVQIFYVGQLSRVKDGDITFQAWPTILLLNIVQSVAVITVCFPYIKGILVGLESGMLQTGHVHHAWHKQVRSTLISFRHGHKDSPADRIALNSINERSGGKE